MMEHLSGGRAYCVVAGPDRGSRRTRRGVAHRVGGAAAAGRPDRADRRVVQGVAPSGVHSGARPGPGAVGPGGTARPGRAVRAGGLGLHPVAGAGRDRPGPTGTDRSTAGADPPPRVGADPGPARTDPALTGADRDLGETIVIRMDAT